MNQVLHQLWVLLGPSQAEAHPAAALNPLPSLPPPSPYAVSLPAVLPAVLPAAQVNSLTSFETDIPFEYYRMPFCKPPEGIHKAGNAANLGTVIMGIKLENSQYNFTVMVRVLTGGWAPAAGSAMGKQAACDGSGVLRPVLSAGVRLWCLSLSAEARAGQGCLPASGLLRPLDKGRREGAGGVTAP